MSETENEDDSGYVKACLRQLFDQSIDEQLERYRRAKVHPVRAHQFFSPASAECRDMFVAGHYYGCICLAQSVAEGLGRFIAERNGMHPPGDFRRNVETLLTRKLVSDHVANALLSIHGKDRNDFHHLNKGIQTDRRQLEDRAEKCLQGLLVVESDIFAFKWGQDGGIREEHPKYWDHNEDGRLAAYVQFL